MTSALDVGQLSRAVLDDRDGYVVVLKVYMDESGTHGGSPVVAVGAYYARPRVWQDWTREWNAKKRPIKVYHATDANAFDGEFKGWSKPDRDQLVIKLLGVLARHDLRGIAMGINLKDFEAAIASRPDLRRIFGNPYIACFYWTIQTIMLEENNSRMAFFHENNDYMNDAIRGFEIVKQAVCSDDRQVTLSFGGKNDYTPLQAADILAYETNHRIRDAQNPAVRKSWQALNPKERITIGYWDKTNMDEIVHVLNAVQTDSFMLPSSPLWRAQAS